jgi:outer membrane protein assembly factor BamB
MDGVDVQYLVALDKKTGQNVWKTNRSVEWNDQDDTSQMVRDGDRHKAHSTPVLINVNGKSQLLSGGAKAAYAYDPRTGKELWRVRYPAAWSAAPMPLYQDGIAFFISGFGKTEMLAVRVNGEGDVTDTHIVWRTESLVAKTASPILVAGLLYMVTDDGVVSCREPKTGEQLWRGSIGGKYAASPIYGDGRLYFSNQQGKTTVLKPGRTMEILGTNTLSGGFMASPAVSGKALYLRTKTHLARIEAMRD